MKKLFLLIPVLLLSCNKKEAVAETTLTQDSMVVVDQPLVENSQDSANRGLVILPEAQTPKEMAKAFRVMEGNKIIRTINADMIPLKVTDEFTTNDQQYILKIKNFSGSKISGQITPENPDLNIRFNQIRLADGKFDGPFSREMTYDVKEKGEIWLLISKSNMASGESKGKFTVNIQ